MKNFIIPMLLLLFTAAYSQKQDNIWYFGNNAGLDFNSGIPLPLSDGMISTDEGVSTVSDANGNLLFYTDGVVVYNKNHQIMQYGIGLLGDSSSSQSAIIIPKPGSTDRYYIFTTDTFYHSFTPQQSGINYSEIDMAANNGLGAVINKNINLVSESSEHLTATYHRNGKDIWVLGHGYDDDRFYAFHVNENGVSNNVVSEAGAAIPPWPNDGRGNMKISPQGNALAISHANFGPLPGEAPIPAVQLFTFNNATGIVSNPQVLSYGIMAYGVEFSANGKLLYISSELSQTERVVQYNLEAIETTGSVVKTIIDSTENPGWGGGAIQMASDGKIYFSVASKNTISVINTPDGVGSACGFTADSVTLGSGTSVIGLPFRMAVTNPEIQIENICLNQPSVFSIKWSTDALSIHWDFGDGSTSAQSNPIHIYAEPGNYVVTASVVGQGQTWTVSKEINISEMAALNFSEKCEDDVHTLSIEFQDNIFDEATSVVAWSGPNGFIAYTATIVTPATGQYNVVVTPDAGCPITAAYTVDSTSCSIPRGISPNEDGLNDSLDLTEFNVTRLSIFNRFGILVYEAGNYTSQWYGQTNRDEELPTGTYYYLAELPSGKKKSGWVYINRQS